MQHTERITDFLFSGALNGPLNSNFLKEQIYVAHPACFPDTAGSIRNTDCMIQVTVSSSYGEKS